MRMSAVYTAWWRILHGYKPFLSIEVTRQCPLRCPGCYAYGAEHLRRGDAARDLAEWRGEALIGQVLDLVRRHQPLHVSLVGGEPLVRLSEMTTLIGRLNAMRIETQVVTSAVRTIPAEWSRFENLHLAVSIDGLPPEHDARRAPATYDRILRNIEGHQVIVHCTVTPQLLAEPDYLREFTRGLSSHPSVRRFWFSLYTPQAGERSRERLSPEERTLAIDRIAALGREFPKVHAPSLVIQGLRRPPASPADCIFAQTTTCVASDLATPVVPCQIGGQPECAECGCFAAAGIGAIGRFKLAGLLKVSDIFVLSKRLGDRRRAGDFGWAPGDSHGPAASI